MTIQIKQLKVLDGSFLDVSAYKKNDKGKYGKAVDIIIENILPGMYNLGPGVDIPSLNLEVKSLLSNRKPRSHTTWIKITNEEVGMFHWQLSDEKQQKLTADRLFVCVNINGSYIDYHKVVRYNTKQQELFKTKFDQLSKLLKHTGYNSASSQGFMLERKTNSSVVEFRIQNARLQRLNGVTHTTFDTLFESED